MPRLLRSLVLAGWLAAASVAAQVPFDPIDHLDALLATPARSVQIEATSATFWDPPNQTDITLLSRWGLGAGWEIRAGLPSYTYTAEHSGFGDPTLGVKTELGEALGWALAATGDVSIPVGGPEGNPYVEAVATLTAGHDLPASFALEAIGELAMDAGASTPIGAVALVVSRRAFRQLDAAVDVTVGIEDMEVSLVVLQNGYAWLLSPVVQLGAVVGVGVAGESAPDALIGFSVSVRR